MWIGWWIVQLWWVVSCKHNSIGLNIARLYGKWDGKHGCPHSYQLSTFIHTFICSPCEASRPPALFYRQCVFELTIQFNYTAQNALKEALGSPIPTPMSNLARMTERAEVEAKTNEKENLQVWWLPYTLLLYSIPLLTLLLIVLWGEGHLRRSNRSSTLRL